MTNSIETLVVEGPELDAVSGATLESAVRSAFERNPAVLVLDLRNVRFIDSLGVSFVVRLARLAPKRSRLVLTRLNRYVQTVAKVTHLSSIVEIVDEKDIAIRFATAA